MDWNNKLLLYLNGKQIEVVNPDPSMTLLSFIRSRGLTGTKLGCGEGGCGACTVMISSYNHDTSTIEHISCNACLAPLCSLDNCAITTIEGIGGMKQGLHPIQKRIAQFHGSQCGFCTPGIVMSVYSQFRSKPQSTPHELEESLDGNLCRCTGYRPILDAVKSLSNNKSCCNGEGNCDGCQCFDGNSTSDQIISSTEIQVKHAHSLNEELDSLKWTEPIFPPALHRLPNRSNLFNANDVSWYQPIDISTLLQLKQIYPNAKLVIGNTEVGIETKFKGLSFPTIISASRIPELKTIAIESIEGNRGLKVGSSVTLNKLKDYISSLVTGNECKSYELRGLIAINQMLTWFASNQIRNVASIAGNIITASPISDLNPLLIACRSSLYVTSLLSQSRIPIKDFFLSYRKVKLEPTEIVEYIFIPFTTEYEFIVPLKQARRREDDISIVTSGMNIKLNYQSNHWIIEDAMLAFGGLAPTTICANKTSTCLSNQLFNTSSYESAYETLCEEISLPSNVPGGQAEYRMTLALTFLFRSYLLVNSQLTEYIRSFSDGQLDRLPEAISTRVLSAINNFIVDAKHESRGEQSYYKRHEESLTNSEETKGSVGQSLMHKSASAQVTGEAIYTNDIPMPSNTCYAALVLSTRAHARLISIESSAAERSVGFIAFYSAKDITGSNHIGAVVKDEEVFVTEYVKHFGAVLGVVIATSHELANSIAKKVVVNYEDLPAIITIDDAIKSESFFEGRHEIVKGDVKQLELESDLIVEGDIKLGGQEHFYLETNCTVAIPHENDHLEIYSSTQNPTKTQNFCAYVTGLPASHVVARCKRMGGGFGGKETRSVFIACTAALSAYLLGRPVSINIERDVDMSITGQRHAFYLKYRAGCSKEGKLQFVDSTIYSNGGYSLDLSQAVLDRALFHSDNVYNWPAMRVRGLVCKTNQPSHTAFRGFGGPQGLLLSETIIEHFSRSINIPSNRIRESNFYEDGNKTHFGQTLVDFYIPSLWEKVIRLSNYSDRKTAIDEFNSANRWKKRGINALPTKFGINFTAKFMNQGGALVHVYQDGTVLIAHGGTEMGQGLHTKMIQVAAQSFNIPDNWVHISETATNTVANASPTAASMSTDLYGMAVLDACEQILKRLEPIRQSIKKQDFDPSWKEIITAAFFSRVDLSAHGYYIVPTDRCGYDWDLECDDNSKRGQPFNYFTQGVAVSEVEVDVLTGDTKIIRADILMDLGKSINPAIDIGQIEGAFIQGYGWCTMEELVWGDKDHLWIKTGQLFTRGPGTYKIPSFNDVPIDFRVHLSDTDNRFAVHSSKAVGEPPFFLGCSPAFAIKEAIYAAREEIGLSNYITINHPVTSERIRMACSDKFTSLTTNNNADYVPSGSW